jgi:hypothetical protein
MCKIKLLTISMICLVSCDNHKENLNFSKTSSPSVGCNLGKQTKMDGDFSSDIKLVKEIARTPKSILNLVSIDEHCFVLKEPKDKSFLSTYLEKLDHHWPLIELLNGFSFTAELKALIIKGENKGLLLDYFHPKDWLKLNQIRANRVQLENIIGQVLMAMTRFNSLSLRFCVLNQENLLISPDFTVMFIDRDDIECIIGQSKVENESRDLKDFKIIFSDTTFLNNNSEHRSFIMNILQRADMQESPESLLNEVNPNFNKNHINDIDGNAKMKIKTYVQKFHEIKQKISSSRSQDEIFSQVVSALTKAGITKYNPLELKKFYRQLINDARKNSTEEFAYTLGHGELDAGFSYYGEYVGFTGKPTPPEKEAILQSWLKVFKEFPIEWAQDN